MRKSKAEAQHPRFLNIVKNMGPIPTAGGPIPIKKSKNIITVKSKIDDLTLDFTQKIIDVDPENAVAIEMEAYALADASRNQQLHDDKIVYGVVKAVADYCSKGKELSEEDVSMISKFVDVGEIAGAKDPTGNSELKSKLQDKATQLSFIVATHCIARLDLFNR